MTQVADRRGGRRRGGDAGLIGQQEHQFGAAAAADADGVAGFEHAFGDGLAVDVGAEARAAIAEHEAAAVLDDLGVIARHFAAAETQIVGLPAANRERQLFDGDDPVAERVADFEAWFRHRHSDLFTTSTATGRIGPTADPREHPPGEHQQGEDDDGPAHPLGHQCCFAPVPGKSPPG